MTTTAPGAARAALQRPALQELVDGSWDVPVGTLDLQLEDPYLGVAIGPAVGSGEPALEAALAAADRVHRAGSWSGTSPEWRAEILDAVATALEAEVPRLAALESLATGVPVAQTGIVAMIIPGAFHLAAEMLRTGVLLETSVGEAGNPVEVHRIALGPALCLVPWNAPAPMAAHKVASALAAGAPTIVKPSEYAPWATAAMGRVVDEVLRAEGVASGTFQLVHGGPAVGGRMVTDPRVRAVSFTGGLAGGRAIATACAAGFTALQLELGGNNPLVVMPDADVAEAARHAVDLLTTLNGQWCRALGRLVVPEQLLEPVLTEITTRLAGLSVGDPLDPATDLGPIVHSAHLARLRAAIDEGTAAGGVAHAATPLPDGPGNFLAPTLLTGVAADAAVDEIFGPVATVHTYRLLDEAVELANGTPFGLEGYVVGQDSAAALDVARRVRAGEVKVNGSSIMSLHLMTPRPAWGLSGMGEEGTVETIRLFTGARVVGVEGGYALHGR